MQAVTGNAGQINGFLVPVDQNWARRIILAPRCAFGFAILVNAIGSVFYVYSHRAKWPFMLFAWAITLIIVFLILRRRERKIRNQHIIFWEDGAVTVQCGLTNVLIQKSNKPIEIRFSKTFKQWIIGRGINLTTVKRASVPFAAFPKLDVAYKEISEKFSVSA